MSRKLDDEFSHEGGAGEHGLVQAFPKPKRKGKPKKARWNRSENGGAMIPRRDAVAKRRRQRKNESRLYVDQTRPGYLLALAITQGRLRRPLHKLKGPTPKAKWLDLQADELPLCEIGLAETGCHGRRVAMEVHHKKGRGKYLNRVEWFAGTCRGCHDHVEKNRAWAYANGWLIKRNGVTDDSPVSRISNQEEES